MAYVLIERQTDKKEQNAVVLDNNHSYQRKGILSYLSNTYMEFFHRGML